MKDPCRYAAVVLMLACQLAGGMIVVCDEGIGAQSLELFPQACCGSESEAEEHPAPASQRVDQAPCDSCHDVPLVVFHRSDDEPDRARQLEFTVVATLPTAPLDRFVPRGVFARGTSPPGVVPTAARLTGTVVQLC